MRSFFTIMLSLGSFLLFFFYNHVLDAQGIKLGVQGILKKSSVAELDDGNCFIIFRPYNTNQGGNVLWRETQSDVEVTSFINIVAPGSVTGLSFRSNEDYYLGVRVGVTPKMSPWAKQIIALYALLLKGHNNLFLSTGAVGVGKVTLNSSYLLHLKNASGVASERIAGATGVLPILKKSNTSSLLEYEASDNNFKIDEIYCFNTMRQKDLQ